jgi:ABC-type transport system substrate-binding protein
MSENSYWERLTRSRIDRRRLLKSGAAFSLGAASLALIGCGSGNEKGGATSTPGTSASPSGTAAPSGPYGYSPSSGTPKKGGTYTTAFTTVNTYNVGKFYAEAYQNSGTVAYDRPITVDLSSGQGYVLEAMQKIELAEPTKVVMTLKPGLTYHNLEPVNGRAVKASDIVAYQKYVGSIPDAENNVFQRNFLDSAEAPDDNTVVYHLKNPSAYLYSTRYLANPSAQPIVPQEMIDILDTHTPVGSGPWQLASNTLGAEYNYKRFDNWRGAKDGLPYFDGRKTLGLTDAVAIETSLRGEQLHEWVNTPPSTADRLQKELDKSKFTLIQYPSLGLWGCNALMDPTTDGPRPWFDIRVRQAIYRLTNRQQILDLVFNGHGTLTTGPIHTSLSAYQLDKSATDKYFKEDVNEAKQLLSAAGYDNSKTWSVTSYNSDPTPAQGGEVWQNQLARADFKVDIQPLPLAEVLPKHMGIGKFDFWLAGQPGGDAPDRAIRNQASDTGDIFNHVGLYDKAMDALVAQSEQATDRQENIRLVKEIEQKALDAYSLSYVFYTLTTFTYINARVQSYFIDPTNGMRYQTKAWFSA